MANSQSSERPDLQDLVAYIQGRGSETLRAQVLKRLDEDEEYLELMMDLVPMLREAGELADPDAAPAPSPIQTFVDAPLPEVAELPPAGVLPMPGKVVALPKPANRPLAAFAALAAIIPALLAVWSATRAPATMTAALGKNLSSAVDARLLEDSPWGDSVMRGGPAHLCESDPMACFDAGAQMVDLEIAIKRESAELARRRLVNLGNSLGKDSFSRYFPGLEAKPDVPPFELAYIEKQVKAGYENVRQDFEGALDFEQGACLRGTFLAAKAKDTSYFEDRRMRRRCLEIVGEASWKPDEAALGELYEKARFDLMDR